MKKSKISPESKENIKNIFGSLINNQRCLEGARHNPWWVALIFFVLSLVFAILPTFVQTINAYGSSALGTYSKGMDTQMAYFYDAMYCNQVDLKVNDKGILTSTNWQTLYPVKPDQNGVQYAKINELTDQYDLLVYVELDPTTDLSALISSITSKQYVTGTHELSVLDDDVKYNPSFIVYSYNAVYMQIYNPNTTTGYSAFAGDYEHLIGYEFKEVTNSAEYTHGSIAKYRSQTEKVYNHFKTFLDNAYINIKNNSIVTRNLITLGIYAGLGLFMGFMIWILTRGKTSLLRYYTFWDSCKISAWMMLSPAILGMILGFMMSSYAMMFFILFFGVRIMWASMKQLRPMATGR